MKQQGLEIIALHFSLEPFTDNSAEIKSKKLAKHIGIKTFITITNGAQQAELTKKCDHRFYYILQRRLYLRIAEKIVKNISNSNQNNNQNSILRNIFGKQGCTYLITGDNIGQVGSQTLKNIEVITRAVNIPILRPILTNDKNETINFAKEIGTYDLSVGPEMCSVLGPKHPATTSTLEKVENEERKIDINQLVEDSLKTMKIESL